MDRNRDRDRNSHGAVSKTISDVAVLRQMYYTIEKMRPFNVPLYEVIDSG
jgi:hypothetical protein